VTLPESKFVVSGYNDNTTTTFDDHQATLERDISSGSSYSPKSQPDLYPGTTTTTTTTTTTEGQTGGVDNYNYPTNWQEKAAYMPPQQQQQKVPPELGSSQWLNDVFGVDDDNTTSDDVNCLKSGPVMTPAGSGGDGGSGSSSTPTPTPLDQSTSVDIQHFSCDSPMGFTGLLPGLNPTNSQLVGPISSSLGEGEGGAVYQQQMAAYTTPGVIPVMQVNKHPIYGLVKVQYTSSEDYRREVVAMYLCPPPPPIYLTATHTVSLPLYFLFQNSIHYRGNNSPALIAVSAPTNPFS